jgi:hypothetical protein
MPTSIALRFNSTSAFFLVIASIVLTSRSLISKQVLPIKLAFRVPTLVGLYVQAELPD